MKRAKVGRCSNFFDHPIEKVLNLSSQIMETKGTENESEKLPRLKEVIEEVEKVLFPRED
jgi:hypothetical protein